MSNTQQQCVCLKYVPSIKTVDAPWAHNVKDCTEVHLKYTTKRPSGQHLVQGVSLILILERGLKLTNRGQGVL